MMTPRQEEIARRLAAMRERDHRDDWESRLTESFPGLKGVPLQSSAGRTLHGGEGLWPAGLHVRKWLAEQKAVVDVTWAFEGLDPANILRSWEYHCDQSLDELAELIGPVVGHAIYTPQGGDASPVEIAVPAAHWRALVIDGYTEAFVVLPESGWIIQLDPMENLGGEMLSVARLTAALPLMEMPPSAIEPTDQNADR